MKITRKVFAVFVQIVKDAEMKNEKARRNLALDLSKFLTENSSTFDCDRFLEACKVN